VKTQRKAAGARRGAAGSIMALCVLGAVMAPGAGCNIVGPAFYLIHGPEKIPPVYKLDPKRPTVVLIDDPSNRVPRRQLRAIMGQTVDDILLKQGLIKADEKQNNLISSGAALTVAAKDKSSTPMSITQVGKAVGAEVVVWIMVDQFSLMPDGQAFSPTVSIRLKFIDAVTDKRVWPPDDAAGNPFRYIYPAGSLTPPESSAARSQAEMSLAEYAGRGIAELFYEVEKPLSVREGNK
jgi:hypothetical protein